MALKLFIHVVRNEALKNEIQIRNSNEDVYSYVKYFIQFNANSSKFLCIKNMF